MAKYGDSEYDEFRHGVIMKDMSLPTVIFAM